MTDLEATVALFERLGLPATAAPMDEKDIKRFPKDRLMPSQVILIEERSYFDEKIHSYTSFYTNWYFNADGSFNSLGIYE